MLINLPASPFWRRGLLKNDTNDIGPTFVGYEMLGWFDIIRKVFVVIDLSWATQLENNAF